MFERLFLDLGFEGAVFEHDDFGCVLGRIAGFAVKVSTAARPISWPLHPHGFHDPLLHHLKSIRVQNIGQRGLIFYDKQMVRQLHSVWDLHSFAFGQSVEGEGLFLDGEGRER